MATKPNCSKNLQQSLRQQGLGPAIKSKFKLLQMQVFLLMIPDELSAQRKRRSLA